MTDATVPRSVSPRPSPRGRLSRRSHDRSLTPQRLPGRPHLQQPAGRGERHPHRALVRREAAAVLGLVMHLPQACPAADAEGSRGRPRWRRGVHKAKRLQRRADTVVGFDVVNDRIGHATIPFTFRAWGFTTVSARRAATVAHSTAGARGVGRPERLS